jgi:hypothetical protein
MTRGGKSRNAEFRLAFERTGAKVKVTARVGGNLAHIDTFDPANARQRERFAKALGAKHPVLDQSKIANQLLKIAEEARIPAPPPNESTQAELDTSRIVRPELFITTEVCGMTVPIVIDGDGGPRPKWKLCLQWANGQREARDLAGHIELPDRSRLWLSPVPGAPAITTASGWSVAARRAWQAGAPAPEPVDVFRRLCKRIADFLELDSEVASATTAVLAEWSILTHVYQAWDSLPYLFVTGPVGSGKTRVFEILSRLVRRPLQSSNLTAAALFRTLNDRGGTLLFDEAERLKQTTPDVQEVLTMLLAGYKRGGQATRLEAVGDMFRTVTFDVFGPKALACIAGLPPALASRCISIRMFRAGPDSRKPQRRIDADPEGWQYLRDDLHALALENGATWLELARRQDVCPRAMNGRGYEIWQPLLALAAWLESLGAEGLLVLLQEFALKSLDGGREDQVPDADETLLEILVEKLSYGAAPTPSELLERAKLLDPATFDRWTARTVSNRLKLYGITARKVDRRREYRDTTLADLERIQRNYGIELGIAGPDRSDAPTAPRASRSVPEEFDSTAHDPSSGRKGTKRDADDRCPWGD